MNEKSTSNGRLEAESKMRTEHKLMWVVIVAVLVASMSWWVREFIGRNGIPIPDEKAAAMELLAAKLSGPRYFNAPDPVIKDSGEPWITPEEVRAQMDRIVRERHWGGNERTEMEQVISRLSEPSPARMVGGYRIPLERLNLALDSLKK